MKLGFIAALLLLPVSGFAQGYGSGVDGQSVFQVSETRKLVFGGTASRTTVLPTDTRVVRYLATQDVHKKEGGASVTATTDDTPLGAWTPEYFKLPTASPRHISAIQVTTSGTLYIDIMKP